MAPAQSKPNLLTLPRELRDIIYEYTLSEQIDIKIPPLQLKTPQVVPPGLTVAPKQLYHETVEPYYKHGRFVVYHHGDYTARQVISRWLIRLPNHCKQALQYARGVQRIRLLQVVGDSNLGECTVDTYSEDYVKRRLKEHGIILPEGALSCWYEAIP